jgi:DNA mismatch repair protein MutL
VRESLGRFSLVPSLDFDTIGVVDIPVLTKNTEIHIPEISVNRDYNPFEDEDKQRGFPRFQASLQRNKNLDWEKLYENFEKEGSKNEPATEQEKMPEEEDLPASDLFFQYKDRFLVVPVKSGLMFIDQKRAHERVLFEKYLNTLRQSKGVAQQNLFPQTLHLGAEEYLALKEISNDLQFLGFSIADLGNNTISINGYPSDMNGPDPENAIRQLIRDFVSKPVDLKTDAREKLAASLSKALAIPYGKKLNEEEIRILVDHLFACDNPGFTFDGHTILYIYPVSELEKKFA